MEAILALTLFVTALLVWKVMELNEQIENLEITTRQQLESVAKLLVELQPKGPVEIPVRLDKELVNELLATETTEMNGLKVTTPKRDDKLKEYYKNQTYTTYNAEVKPRPVVEIDRYAGLTENEKQVLDDLYNTEKKKQRELLKAMMEADERDGLYEDTQTEGHTLSELTEKQKNDIRENVRERKKRSLNK